MRKSKRPRKRPSDQELRDLSEHVAYECDMLIGTAARLLESPPADTIEHNALVESFLLHGRQLYQFFYWDDPKKETDVVAADYIAAWPNDRPEDPGLLKVLSELSTVVGTKVAHVTLHRSQKERYQILDAGRALLAVISQFLDHAPPAFVARPELSLTPSWANSSTGFVYSGGGATTTTAPPSVRDILLRADGPLPKSPTER
jgi:hypothetical protein